MVNELQIGAMTGCWLAERQLMTIWRRPRKSSASDVRGDVATW
jgi:hypothetical protein